MKAVVIINMSIHDHHDRNGPDTRLCGHCTQRYAPSALMVGYQETGVCGQCIFKEIDGELFKEGYSCFYCGMREERNDV